MKRHWICGASPLKAFFKVVFPDIVPGVLSGFMMAFTMSLDDFVITHFTKGPGIDTLSTKIYTEVRKGIKPEIYALSTIMFVTVLVLLLLVNYSPKEEEEVPVPKESAQTIQNQKSTCSACDSGSNLYRIYRRRFLLCKRRRCHEWRGTDRL